jgi:S-adenosyl-L-methionine hydrolase (adenosine-forming)
MRIITLTSDLGHKDPYLPMVKGKLLRLYPDIQIHDISHEIPVYDRIRCAHMLRWTYRSFPEDSIHIFSVEAGTAQSGNGLIAKLNQHYFIGPDNGIISLIALDEEFECYRINNPLIIPDRFQPSLLIRDVFTNVAAFIASGGPIEEVGDLMEPISIGNREPLVREDIIRGEIIHIDRFGNCITNITRVLFQEMKDNRPFKITFRNHELNKIYLEYDRSIDMGDPIALFGATGHLEIASIYGNAHTLFGLNIGHNISLEFINK